MVFIWRIAFIVDIFWSIISVYIIVKKIVNENNKSYIKTINVNQIKEENQK